MKIVHSSLCLLLALYGCGGGSSSPAPASPSSPSPPPVTVVKDYNVAASILDVTTFGATSDEIEWVAEKGLDAWLENQFSLPISYHEPIVRDYIEEYGADPQSTPFPGFYRRFAFFERALTAPDQFRQVVAYALTQFFVVSETGVLQVNPLALSNYYDTLLEHSFGNFRDLLYAVTMHPSMGFYLSHVNNAKTNLEANTFPDENYAREVMQLFSIGLYELNIDGSQRLDDQNRPIATYSNIEIQEFAKIFTGLSYGVTGYSPRSFFGKANAAVNVPMVMFEDFHEPGEKHLLNGEVVPAGQTGMQDIQQAVDNLFNHPNVGPFFGRQLIQRLVSSNPSPEYITRVAEAFNGKDSGVRGDMKAVLTAILTDPEAATSIRVREPFRRFLSLNRSLKASPEDGITYAAAGFQIQNLTGQMVLTAPSVFNFYSPFYRPSGSNGRISPEMQITTEDTIVGYANRVASAIYGGNSIATVINFPRIRLNIEEFIAEVNNPEVFTEKLNRYFFAGQMQEATRSIITNALNQSSQETNINRARLALYLALISPDQAVTGEAL
jgi:uncharacterized protein (DUF1800 family)